MGTITRLLGKCYSVRVTLSTACLPAKFVDDLLLKCEAVVACQHEEEGKRTHIHFALVNSVLTHDPLRKYINVLLKDVTNLQGNALLSVKKWDLSDKYLIYIIKGENPFVINTDNHIPIEEWERLKNLWVSQSVQENDYSAWKASPFFPKKTSFTEQYQDEYYKSHHKFPPSITFDDVRKAALDYALGTYGGFVTAKVRFMAKDLISNYCLFNDIKMSPVYI